MYEEFLNLPKKEQEIRLIRGMRQWGKQRMFHSWLDGLFKAHPEYLEIYGKLVDRWAKAVEERENKAR
jgi:hypothetical protein